MSQSTADTEADGQPIETASDADTDEERDDPAIEEDLFEETLKIDGICGVY